jgi:hypothetical protein
VLNGVFKYIISSYKPTQEWHVSCAILGKGLSPWCPKLLWLWFHPKDHKNHIREEEGNLEYYGNHISIKKKRIFFWSNTWWSLGDEYWEMKTQKVENKRYRPKMV